MAGTSLMSLPAELRLKILREALVSEAALRAGVLEESGVVTPTPMAFFPNVALLRVCRQLYAEGLPLLFENTIGLDARVLFPDEIVGRFCTAMFFNKQFHLCNSKKTTADYLRSHIRKVDINIAATDCITEPVFLDELVSKIVVALSNNPQWSFLTIRLTVDGDLPMDAQEALDHACHTFKYLRGLKQVIFHGISERRAAELIQKMESNEPVANLATMYHALLAYIHVWEEEPRFSDGMSDDEASDLLYDAWRARDEDDTEAFHKARGEIMSRLDDPDPVRRARVFEADPIVQGL